MTAYQPPWRSTIDVVIDLGGCAKVLAETCAYFTCRRPGVCFRMFSRQQWDTMPSHTSPEMLRSPLERVALLIKGMAGHDLLAGAAGLGGVGRVLARCLSPPHPAAVASATQLLRQIGAFDSSEALTALGGHLNRMPMDPRVGECIDVWVERLNRPSGLDRGSPT